MSRKRISSKRKNLVKRTLKKKYRKRVQKSSKRVRKSSKRVKVLKRTLKKNNRYSRKKIRKQRGGDKPSTLGGFITQEQADFLNGLEDQYYCVSVNGVYNGGRFESTTEPITEKVRYKLLVKVKQKERTTSHPQDTDPSKPLEFEYYIDRRYSELTALKDFVKDSQFRAQDPDTATEVLELFPEKGWWYQHTNETDIQKRARFLHIFLNKFSETVLQGRFCIPPILIPGAFYVSEDALEPESWRSKAVKSEISQAMESLGNKLQQGKLQEKLTAAETRVKELQEQHGQWETKARGITVFPKPDGDIPATRNVSMTIENNTGLELEIKYFRSGKYEQLGKGDKLLSDTTIKINTLVGSKWRLNNGEFACEWKVLKSWGTKPIVYLTKSGTPHIATSRPASPQQQQQQQQQLQQDQRETTSEWRPASPQQQQQQQQQLQQDQRETTSEWRPASPQQQRGRQQGQRETTSSRTARPSTAGPPARPPARPRKNLISKNIKYVKSTIEFGYDDEQNNLVVVKTGSIGVILDRWTQDSPDVDTRPGEDKTGDLFHVKFYNLNDETGEITEFPPLTMDDSRIKGATAEDFSELKVKSSTIKQGIERKRAQQQRSARGRSKREMFGSSALWREGGSLELVAKGAPPSMVSGSITAFRSKTSGGLSQLLWDITGGKDDKVKSAIDMYKDWIKQGFITRDYLSLILNTDWIMRPTEEMRQLEGGLVMVQKQPEVVEKAFEYFFPAYRLFFANYVHVAAAWYPGDLIKHTKKCDDMIREDIIQKPEESRKLCIKFEHIQEYLKRRLKPFIHKNYSQYALKVEADNAIKAILAVVNNNIKRDFGEGLMCELRVIYMPNSADPISKLLVFYSEDDFRLASEILKQGYDRFHVKQKATMAKDGGNMSGKYGNPEEFFEETWNKFGWGPQKIRTSLPPTGVHNKTCISNIYLNGIGDGSPRDTLLLDIMRALADSPQYYREAIRTVIAAGNVEEYSGLGDLKQRLLDVGATRPDINTLTRNFPITEEIIDNLIQDVFLCTRKVTLSWVLMNQGYFADTCDPEEVTMYQVNCSIGMGKGIDEI